MRLPSLRELVLFALLASLYTQVPLRITSSIFIPAFITLVIVVPLMFLLAGRTVYKYELVFLFSLALLLAVSTVLSPGPEFLTQKLLGLVQTMVSIAVGVLTLKFLNRTPVSKVARALITFAIILAAGSLLEVIGIFRPISDAFRHLAYGNSVFTVYDAVSRDEQITGFERASFFASEPSVLTKGFFIFLNSWLLVSYKRRNLFLAVLLTALMFAVTGSLVLVVSILVLISIMLFHERSFFSLILCVLGAVAVAVITYLFSPTVTHSIISRTEAVLGLGDNVTLLANDSIGLRIVLPMITLSEVWKNAPFFGLGISGKEVIQPLTGIPVDPLIAFGNNNVTALLMYLGVVGSLCFFAIFAWYFGKLRIRNTLFLFWCIAAFGLTGGGFEEPRTWGYVFLLIWAIRAVDMGSAPLQRRRVLRRRGGSTFRRASVG